MSYRTGMALLAVLVCAVCALSDNSGGLADGALVPPPDEYVDHVTFPGSPCAYGMCVLSVSESEGEIVIETTGARYELTSHALRCYQKLNVVELEGERQIATLQFQPPLDDVELVSWSSDVAVVSSAALWLGFQGDSMVTFYNPLSSMEYFELVSGIDAEWWQYSTVGNLLAQDGVGSFSTAREWGSGLVLSETDCAALCRTGSSYLYTLGPGARLAFAVSPGRYLNRERLYNELVIHRATLPTDEEIAMWGAYANVYVYSGGYVNGTEVWPYEFEDEEYVRERFAALRAAGWKTVSYMNTQAVMQFETDMDVILDWMEQFEGDFGIDGWFFDGVFVGMPWTYSYEFLRRLRGRIGPDSPIYSHTTFNAGTGLHRFGYPWLEGGYSDYILKGENRLIQGPDDPYMRYVINQYRVSNAIGTLKWNAADMTPREALAAMLHFHGSARWSPSGDVQGERLQRRSDLWEGYFYPQLMYRKALWELDILPLTINWPYHDADGDQLPDGWEESYFAGDLLKLNGVEGADWDADGLSDFDEWVTAVNWPLGTDPTVGDTDGDGLEDGWEVQHCFHPIDADEADDDPDGDGLKNVREQMFGTQPRKLDTDADGLPDGWEVQNFFNPLLPADAAIDVDQDGLNTLGEFQAGSNPWNPDTDGDGWLDGTDNCPGHENPLQADCDDDGFGDVCTIATGLGADCNENGVPDSCDIAEGTSQDINGDGVPDECDQPIVLGDLNCDGEIDFDDIEAFVTALTGEEAYYAQFPSCNWLNGDFNLNGVVDFDDIDPLVALLSG